MLRKIVHQVGFIYKIDVDSTTALHDLTHHTTWHP